MAPATGRGRGGERNFCPGGSGPPPFLRLAPPHTHSVGERNPPWHPLYLGTIRAGGGLDLFYSHMRRRGLRFDRFKQAGPSIGGLHSIRKSNFHQAMTGPRGAPPKKHIQTSVSELCSTWLSCRAKKGRRRKWVKRYSSGRGGEQKADCALPPL